MAFSLCAFSYGNHVILQTVTGVPPIQTAVRAKAPIQEISSGITASVPVATSQVRAQLQTGTTTVTTGLTQVQLAQRITAATTLASGGRFAIE